MLTGSAAFGDEDVHDHARERARARAGLEFAAADGLARASARRCDCAYRRISKKRVADIRDVRLALEGAFETAASQTTASATSSTPRGRLAWMAAFAVAARVGRRARHSHACGTCAKRRRAETRVDIVTPATDDPVSFALSPDGRQIVFVASGDGASRLWLRSLATTTAQPLAGTEGASVSLLVARQPIRRLLRRGRAEAARPRRRRAANPGAGRQRQSWRDVERGRRHRVCAEPD